MDARGGQIFVVWDCYNQNEFTSLITSQEDMFVGYFTGKSSKIGYLGFNNLIFNIDFGLPNPYFGIDNFWSWRNKGPMINDTEQIILTNGTIQT